MSVHYKFKSALEYDTVTFDGLHISVKDLKKAILHQKKIGKTSDFDLQITNAQTKETYTDENVLIPKNTSLIVARVPLTQQQRKQWEKEKLLAAGKLGEGNDQNALGQVDISSLDLSEEDKIKTMMSQSTSDYDPSNYVKVRGGNQIGAVPPSYICFKCHQRGHWIKDCPAEGSALGTTETIKKSTGIPRSFMIEVEGPQVPGARMTPSGHYAVPVIDHEVYKEKKIEKPPFLAEKEKPAQTPSIPEDLVCGICQDLLQDAVMVPCCGISFCNDCIQNALIESEDNQCPDCSEKDVSPDTLIPNRFLRTSVNTFKNKTGYVKTKTHIIQQRPPSPPRPSLPDFVPPPEYVDPSSTSTDTQRQSSKATPSPIYQSSPASALQITHSPFQNQTTPVYSESSPFGDNSNSFSIPDKSPAYQDRPHQYGGQPPYGVDPYRQGPYPSQRYPGPGHFQNFRHPPANFSGQFAELPPGVSPAPGASAPRGMGSENYYRNKGPKERLGAVRKEVDIRDDLDKTPSDSQDASKRGQENGVKTSPSLDAEKSESKLSEPETRRRSKKSGLDVDDVSSVSSTASEEPPPPAESHRPAEGHHDPSQGHPPSYAIPSLFSGQHPVTLPPPGTVPYPPPPHPRPGDVFPHSSSAEERSSTPTVDERLEVPPIRPPYDPYRPPNYMAPGYDPHYGMPPVPPMPPYDPNMMYDRGFRGHPRGPRMHRQRYTLRQPPPPGSRPLTPPGNEEEAFLAFQRMLKEKEERDKRKNEKLKSSRRSNSRSRSRSAARSRRSYSGGRSRTRSRSRTPNRRSRSRSKKRTRSRSRSFVISRSRSRSYSRSPLHERNYSPKKYYSPHRSPQRYERYEGNYGHWNQDHREYRRGGFRGRGRGRFYNKNSPPRGHDHQSYNREAASSSETAPPSQPFNPIGEMNLSADFRYRNENYSTSPTRHYKSPNRYYDQHRVSPRHNDYSRDSRDRDYRSYDRESEPAVRERSSRRRSHSNSVARNNFDSDRPRERERERDRDRDREGSYRCRSLSRQSNSRKYSPARKASPVRSERARSKEKSPEIKHKDYDKQKEARNRSRERRSYDNTKEKRKHSRERERSKDYDRRHKSRERSEINEKSRHDKDRSRSKEIKRSKRSPSKEKKKRSLSRRRSSSRHKRSVSRSKEERRRSETPEIRKKGSESPEREKDRSISRDREEVIKRSPSREKLRNESPKIPEEDEKKEKKKDKDKKKKKKEKEKETDEERAARKKRKKEKKEEKKRKQEIKAAAELKNKESKEVDELEEESKIKAEKNSPKVAPQTEPAPNFVSTFKEVPADDLKSSPNAAESPRHKFDSSGDQNTLLDSAEDGVEENLEPGEIIDQDEAIEIKDDASESGRRFMSVISGDNNSEEMDTDRGLGDDNVELEIHASYESLCEESGENQKKGILAPVPEKSKWELDESQVSATDSSQKQKGLTSAISPEFPVKVTREVIKRAENAIFKRAVNAIREPAKKSSEKEERKERKVIVAPERDRSKDRTESEGEKVRRVTVQKEKEKVHRSTIEITKPKTEVKRTINSLQITVPLRSENENAETEKVVKVKRKDDHSSRSSPPAGRISIKDRLGSKVEKLSRNPSPVSRTEKRRRSTDDEYSDSKSSRREQSNKPTLSSAIESIDPKRSTIDESHFVPNYDESSDEEETPKSRHVSEKESKSKETESKKRQRSSSDSSEESTRKHKKKKSKNKKSKKKKRKHVSDSSDSSDSEREKKKHKKSKKKKKSKH